MTSSKFLAATHKLSLMTLAVLGVASSASVLAQDASGWYIGGNVGRSKASDFDNSPITNSLIGQGFTVNSITQDKRDTAYKIFTGYQLNRNFAVEGGYFDLGKFNYRFNTTPAGSLNGNTRINGLNLDLVGMLPISDRFSFLGRVGANYARSTANLSNTGAVPPSNFSSRRNNTNLKMGVGLQYDMTPALALRAELERYHINDPIRNRGHVDVASLGLVYRFGGKVQTPVAQAYMPAPIIAPAPRAPEPYVAPPPAPIVVAPQPPPPMPVYVPPVREPKQGRN